MKSLFYPYLLAQFPDSERFSEILDLTLNHADAIEIGIPFTDPVADGPVLATAASEVLARGFFMDSLFKILQSKVSHVTRVASGTMKIPPQRSQAPSSIFSPVSRVPIALMSYANPILAYGRREFLQASVESGAQYLIVPDVPFEESDDWRQMTKEHGIAWISFISLSTGSKRLERIAASAEGFLYLLSLKGITGATIHGPEEIRSKALHIKEHTKVPVALGFGIKSAEDVLKYQGVIDAFIVGSRIVEIIRSNSTEKLREFYESFRRLS